MFFTSTKKTNTSCSHLRTRPLRCEKLENRELLTTTYMILDFTPDSHAGSFVDALQETLDQGVPVCRSSFFDCDLLQGELCCTSDRLTAVDLGFCLPALVCLGDVLP